MIQEFREVIKNAYSDFVRKTSTNSPYNMKEQVITSVARLSSLWGDFTVTLEWRPKQFIPSTFECSQCGQLVEDNDIERKEHYYRCQG